MVHVFVCAIPFTSRLDEAVGLLRARAAALLLVVHYSYHTRLAPQNHLTQGWFDHSSAQPQGYAHHLPPQRNYHAPVALRLVSPLKRLNRARI